MHELSGSIRADRQAAVLAAVPVAFRAALLAVVLGACRVASRAGQVEHPREDLFRQVDREGRR